MRENRGYHIFDRRLIVDRRRRRTTTDMCRDTYRPLLYAMTTGNRLLEKLLLSAGFYLVFCYQGYEIKLAGVAGAVAVAGNFIVDLKLAGCRRAGEPADLLHSLLFIFSLMAAVVPAFVFLLTSGNTSAVSVYGVGLLWYLGATSAVIIPSILLLITLWWGAFVILFKEKYLQQAEGLKANRL